MHTVAVVIEVVFTAAHRALTRLRTALAGFGAMRLRTALADFGAMRIALSLAAAVLAGGCGQATGGGAHHTSRTTSSTRHGMRGNPVRRTSATTPSAPGTLPIRTPSTPLHKPANLTPFTGSPAGGQGVWRAAGRRVDGVPAVYETTLIAPGGSQPAGIAWMDTHLLAARLYSGSESPGGGPYRYTAPIQQASARYLVAAFNGGFKMNAARGGYYTEGRMVDPLRRGAASLVIYADGSVNVGAWGSDVGMTSQVAAVRQNLVPLVAGGQPTPRAKSPDWQAWGSTCGASSCAHSVPGIEHQWRSALGVTTAGALVYVQGPALDPRQLAALLVRARVLRGMELDINPSWPVFATYDPASAHGLATPSNGHLLTATVRGPDTFFEASWARDFITMSARRSLR
jgi:hypothetical protein